MSPISPGPTVPPRVRVSVWATGAVFAVVVREVLGPSLLAEVGVSVPPKAMVKVPPAASDWIRMRSVLLGSAIAVTWPLMTPLALIAVTRASRTACGLASGVVPSTVMVVPLMVMLEVSPAVSSALGMSTPSSWPEPLPARLAVNGVPATSATIWKVLPTTLLPVTMELMPALPLMAATRAEAAWVAV